MDTGMFMAQALALYKNGDRDQAALICVEGLARDPACAEARHLLGAIALERGEPAVAVDHLAAAVALRPGVADYHYNLGNALAAAGRPAEAAAAFRQALTLHPHDAAAHNNLGNALLALGRPADAEAAFARALKFDRSNGTIHLNRFNALLALGQLEEAEAACEAAAAAGVATAEAWNGLAAAHRQTGGDAAAERLLARAIAQQADFPEAWSNRAAVLLDLGRTAEAEAAACRALALRPGYATAHNALGTVLAAQRRFAEAAASFRAAIAERPDYAEAHWNLALALLALGDLATGFAEFEWRLRLPGAEALYPDLAVPPWQGEHLEGKRLLLEAEQGLGDTLQFIRYAALAASRGAQVWARVPRPLVALVARVPGVTQVLESGRALPPLDYACRMMSLPHRFATSLETVPAPMPYISAPPDRVAAWAGRIGAGGCRPRVGLVWAGEPRPDDPPSHRIDQRRSMRLDQLAPLLAVSGIDFFSLQKGAGAAQLEGNPLASRLIDWTPELTDFTETAALVSHLDLVIGVDTSVIHLAGGMGKPVWMFSRFDGCWRWLLDRQDSPWYPSLRIFRQEQPLDWAPTVAAAAAALVRWQAEFTPSPA